jgi:hypothetical protein
MSSNSDSEPEDDVSDGSNIINNGNKVKECLGQRQTMFGGEVEEDDRENYVTHEFEMQREGLNGFIGLISLNPENSRVEVSEEAYAFSDQILK